ncbi:hypothetical protein [Geoanaerobacter pelophilus]|uniref:hypothetical protein n=1 Tax=Geoanaerobacter pelophilus TaxID=60036 RepID=UPI000A26A747|nr:hypothetical protein [Geoanaerobacter pelophilus]
MPETQAQPQTQTQTQSQPPVHVVKQHSFGTFALTLTLFIILAIFCVVYLNIRRKREPRHVDEKAGDEGED